MGPHGALSRLQKLHYSAANLADDLDGMGWTKPAEQLDAVVAQLHELVEQASAVVAIADAFGAGQPPENTP